MPHLTVQIPWFETMNRFGLVSLVGFWPWASSWSGADGNDGNDGNRNVDQKVNPRWASVFVGYRMMEKNHGACPIVNSLDGTYPPLGTGWDSGYDFLLSMCTKIHLLQANWSTSRSLYFRNQASCLQTQPRVYTIVQASQYLSFCDRLPQFRNTAWSGKSGLARCISSSRNGRGSFWSCQQEGEKGLNDKSARSVWRIPRVPLLFRPFCVDFCFELLDWSWPDIDEGCLPTAGWLPC